MRIWDLPPSILCRQHLLGEHRELHGLWNILVLGKTGYSHHPETLRWVGKLRALYNRHATLVEEMERRGYNHATPLDKRRAKGVPHQDERLISLRAQRALLTSKGCSCGSSFEERPRGQVRPVRL